VWVAAGWHDALRGLAAHVDLEVICRTCGLRSLKVCWCCLRARYGGDNPPVTAIYCTDMTKPHEVVTFVTFVEVEAL
jgi:hypothetical protein